MRNSDGFTLVEVLVAFVICVVSLSAFLQVFGASLTNARISQDYATATLLSRSKLAAIGRLEPLRAGETSGRFDDRFRWRLVTRRYQAEAAGFEAAPFPPYQLTLTVSWPTGAEDRSIALTTLRLAAESGAR